MNDINATIGLYNLPHMVQLLEKSRKNFNFLYDNLKSNQNIELCENSTDRLSACWLFTMKVNKKHDFIEKLKSNGITASQVHNRNDINTCVSEFKSTLQNLDELEKRLICIPVGWWLNQEDLDYMVNVINSGW